MKNTREYFKTFNIPEEIATDDSPQMTSPTLQSSLKAWCVHHCLISSSHYNYRAELAVQTGKKLLCDNVGPNGSLDNDMLMRAVMQLRITPIQDYRRSPAHMVFGRQMRDFLPNITHEDEPVKDWAITQEYR